MQGVSAASGSHGCPEGQISINQTLSSVIRFRSLGRFNPHGPKTSRSAVGDRIRVVGLAASFAAAAGKRAAGNRMWKRFRRMGEEISR